MQEANIDNNLIIKPFAEIISYDGNCKLEDCYFYHTIDLPRIGTIRGHWDIRGSEAQYLGNVDFKGKTFFDCGVASGFLSFEMERRGATVIGLDLDETQDPNMGLIPHWDWEGRYGQSMQTSIGHRRASQRQLRNSFLYSRAAFDSKVRLLIGNIMLSPIPKEEQAHGAFFGAILLHLRDPIGAIYNVARNVSETIIITEPSGFDNLALDDTPNMMLRASPSEPTNVGTWFYMYPSFLKRALEVVGFTRFSIEKLFVRDELNSSRVQFFSLVAQR